MSGSIYLESDNEGHRYLQFHRWLQMQFNQGLNHVSYERPIGYHQPITIKPFAFYECTVLMMCACYNVSFSCTYPSTLKAYTTGSGKADKKDMIKTIQRIIPDLELMDDNHCDAVAIWLWGNDNEAQADEVKRIKDLKEKKAADRNKKSAEKKAAKNQKKLF